MTRKIGATGKFPEGKLNESDEGELAIGFRIENGNVVIDFGKPVHWLGFAPDKAKEFATAIMEAAEHIEDIQS